MSQSYPSIVADTISEVDAWLNKTMERVAAMPATSVQYDTGIVTCRLMPIFPTKAAGRQLWWPIPVEIVELAPALECLQQSGLAHDKSRKSKIGYQRALIVSTF